jgi:DNA helicase-2/ATP-dependent DNA helicase PcrA
MTRFPVRSGDDTFDDEADALIERCITAEPPCSFYLSAGAGSGKTRSLVRALQVIREKAGPRLRLQGRRVGVITFTNKASEEISRRLDFDELVSVSTIHSFAWSLVKGFDKDIKEWLKENLRAEIYEINEKQRKGRPGTKAAVDRENALVSKNSRLTALDDVRRFIYNPDSDNHERNSLNHAEVIRMTSAFLADKPLLQKLLASQYPILLIDESQDTNKELIDALVEVARVRRSQFALGVIGDAMQRIYLDGRRDLDEKLPNDWARPIKQMNHRSGHRIVKLINRIRGPVDKQEQMPRSDQGSGHVRLFIASAETGDKPGLERQACERMAAVTDDQGWCDPGERVKTLLLEHRMAAVRLGFLQMWDALNSAKRLQTGLRDGSLAGIRFFSHVVLPLKRAQLVGDRIRVAAIVRSRSPLLERESIEIQQRGGVAQLAVARSAVESLASLFAESAASPTFAQVLRNVHESGLFVIPDALRPFAASNNDAAESTVEPTSESDDELVAWRTFLETCFAQVESYSRYIGGEAEYDTHQGVKGLEFPRVCVVIDDSEARGFTFSYEKLFRVKDVSTKKPSGEETAMDRTRRLLYVTCSRARDSLALVAYTSNAQRLRTHVLEEGWFTENEVELMGWNGAIGS